MGRRISGRAPLQADRRGRRTGAPYTRKLAGSLGVTDKVIFVGKVDHADIPLYFAASDYYVTASLTEMMSISMLEGMSMGLPAVIRFDPVNKQQVQDGVNGFIYHDKKQFAEIVRRLAQYTPTQLDDFHRRVREATLTASSDRNVDKILLQYEKAKEIHAARQGKEKRERKIFRFKTKVWKIKAYNITAGASENFGGFFDAVDCPVWLT